MRKQYLPATALVTDSDALSTSLGHRKYHVTLTETDLEFGYVHSWAMKRVSRQTIERVEVVPAISGLWQWGGYGIRYNPFAGWEMGYIYKDGPGLRIAIKGDNDKTYHYTFNVEKPDDLKKLLE